MNWLEREEQDSLSHILRPDMAKWYEYWLLHEAFSVSSIKSLSIGKYWNVDLELINVLTLISIPNRFFHGDMN